MSQQKTIQQKINELEALTAWFDSEEFELEAALDKFQSAQKMAQQIDDDLALLKNKITVIEKDFSEK